MPWTRRVKMGCFVLAIFTVGLHGNINIGKAKRSGEFHGLASHNEHWSVLEFNKVCNFDRGLFGEKKQTRFLASRP